jgi:hypothetical protein
MSVCVGPKELAELTARGRVLKGVERALVFGDDRRPDVVYAGPPAHDWPVLPLMPWGIAYDLDLVFIGDHPKWDMLEIARVQLDGEPLWLAKEARRGEGTDLGGPPGEQTIVGKASEEVLRDWLPEVPVRRKTGLEVERSGRHGRHLALSWTNHDDEAVTAKALIPRYIPPALARNGPTFRHSQHSLVAVLDLARSGLFRGGRWAVNGADVPLKRALCLQPLTVALGQTQGGLAQGTWTHRPTRRGLTLALERGELRLERQREPSAEVWRTVDPGTPFRTIEAVFLRHKGSLELLELLVRQWPRYSPVTRVRFGPALPDLRRPLAGATPHESKFVIDINGRRSHAFGSAIVTPDPETGRVTLDLVADRPHWVAARPLRTVWDPGTATSTCTRV